MRSVFAVSPSAGVVDVSSKESTWLTNPSGPFASHVGGGMLLERSLRFPLRAEPQLPAVPLKYSRAEAPTPTGDADSPRETEAVPLVFGRPASRKAEGPGGGPHFLTSGQRPLNPRRWT